MLHWVNFVEHNTDYASWIAFVSILFTWIDAHVFPNIHFFVSNLKGFQHLFRSDLLTCAGCCSFCIRICLADAIRTQFIDHAFGNSDVTEMSFFVSNFEFKIRCDPCRSKSSLVQKNFRSHHYSAGQPQLLHASGKTPSGSSHTLHSWCIVFERGLDLESRALFAFRSRSRYR